MESIIERCCGLDVHKKSVVACAITPEVQACLSQMGNTGLVGPPWVLTTLKIKPGRKKGGKGGKKAKRKKVSPYY